ncbi:MAG: dTDP-4-dehydrorhamnose 3,5-epimerase [Nitrospirae bacterium]|nr:MAG: dTDP-4-dehydrorhamnose 3,5-epimerase [Nitrospirota bacterium]
MNVGETTLPGVYLIEPRVFQDPRGYFLETWHASRYHQAQLPVTFVQANFAQSRQGVLRGLHYQLHHPQGKLVWVTRGAVFDVAVDIRMGSPTFGQWVGEVLSEENHRQLYVPPGFAHGYCVLSNSADFFYLCTDFYTPGDEYGVRWDDSDLAIPWPIAHPILSDKDARLPKLSEISHAQLPSYSV